MHRRARRLVDKADALRRAHGALGEALVVLRNVSLRSEEGSANTHRLRLAEAQVFEARYHLGLAHSELAVGLGVREPHPATVLPTVSQVVAARLNIQRLEQVRTAVAQELRSLAHRAGTPALAHLEDPLPVERIALPLAELALLAGVLAVLGGIVALLVGYLWTGGLAILVGFASYGLAAERLAR